MGRDLSVSVLHPPIPHPAREGEGCHAGDDNSCGKFYIHINPHKTTKSETVTYGESKWYENGEWENIPNWDAIEEKVWEVFEQS